MNNLNALESAHILGFDIVTEGLIFNRKPNVKNLEKWDTNPSNCILFAFIRTNSKIVDRLCNNHNRPVIDIHLNEIDPWSDELDEVIMGIRQSQYRDIYNALENIPVVRRFLKASELDKDELNNEEVKEIDRLHSECVMEEGPTRQKLIKDVISVLSPLGKDYRFILKGLDEKDMSLVSGLESLPYIKKK